MDLEVTVKKYITSLLTSTPLVVTIQQLEKDYTNTIGEPVPYQKLGYNSLEHLLRSIPDTVRVNGSGFRAQVIPVISQKSAHINELVSNQKIVPKKRTPIQQRKRAFFPAGYNNYSGGGAIPKKTENRAPTSKIYYPPKTNTRPPRFLSQPASSSYTNGKQHFNFASSNVSTSNNNTFTSTPLLKSNINLPPQQTKCLENIKQFQERENLEIKNVDEKHTSSSNWMMKPKKFIDIDRASTDLVEDSVPFQVRNNLRSLIRKYPEGVWCAAVPDIYKNMFRRELNYQELGFKSLIHLCVSLSSIFHYVRPSTEDYKLYDRSRPLPDCVEKTYTLASFGSASKNLSNVDSAGALPNIDWADIKRFIPEDIFMFGKEIPRAFIPHDVRENDNIDVTVGEVYDLSKFWVCVTDGKLDELMDDMQVFYKEHHQEYLIPDNLIREGIYCVQIIFNEYHRALIVDKMPEVEDTIRVVFIDYGTMSKVSTKGLCFLHVNFSKLPAQAIRCRLSNVFPLEEGGPWTREACRAFRKQVVNKDFTAKISHINWEEQYLELYLADVTNEDDIFYINDKLVEEGFARQTEKERTQPVVDPIYTPIVKYLHLFPTFLELEHGLAPSTVEMEIFYDCNLPINFCYPQYFYIDHSREEEVIKQAEKFHEKHFLKSKRRLPSACLYESERFKAPELDMEIFGDLRPEMEEFLNSSTAEREYEDIAVEEEEKPQECDVDYSKLTEQIEELRTKEEETVSVLRKDLVVTENIMKDIVDICKFRPGTVVVEDLNFEDYVAAGSEPSHYSDEDFMHHPLSTLRFEENSIKEENDLTYDLKPPDLHLSSGTFTYLPEEPPLTVFERLKLETDRKINDFLNDEVHLDIWKKNEENVALESTNPFKMDATATTTLKVDLTKLKPNNPFLHFLQNDKIETASNASTDYESFPTNKVQHSWSSFTDMSAETISQLGKSLRGKSDSSDSMKLPDEKRSCSTQTSNKENKGVQAEDNRQRYFLPVPQPPPPMPYNYAPGPYGGGNPYYSVRFANYQGVMYESQYVPPGLAPPPGFAPPGDFVPMQFRQPRPMMQNPCLAPSAVQQGPNVVRCAAGSSTMVNVNANKDFYDVYNEQLRHKMNNNCQ